MDRIQDGFISDCIGPIFTPTEPTPEAEPSFCFFCRDSPLRAAMKDKRKKPSSNSNRESPVFGN